MIKLIATDLDGTLLHTDKSLPEGFLRDMETLIERGVIFVAASGRQFDNIRETLRPLSGKMYIISENGAINGYGDKVEEEHRMSGESVKSVLDYIRTTGGRAHAVCCCAHLGMYSSDEPGFLREMSRYYFRRERVTGEELDKAPACKIALYCYGKSAELYADMPVFEGTENVISGVDWVDVAPVGVNKGNALAAILKKTGIKPEECLAFGDNFNDREMLALCGERYVVGNAPDGMKKLFPAIGGNDEDAVAVKLREIFGL